MPLLGLAGPAVAAIAAWLTPVLIGMSAVLLGRSHYVLYVLKRGSRSTAVVTWLATVLVVVFWTWQLTVGLDVTAK
jgi:hypothetical protein